LNPANSLRTFLLVLSSLTLGISFLHRIQISLHYNKLNLWLNKRNLLSNKPNLWTNLSNWSNLRILRHIKLRNLWPGQAELSHLHTTTTSVQDQT
jgi:hypothetical protein